MKKIKLYLSLFIFSMLLSPYIVLAEDTTNSLDGPELTSQSETISYDIKINAQTAIDGYEAALTYETSSFELIGIESKNEWKGNNKLTTDSPIKLVFNRENEYTGEIVVATLRFKVKEDASKTDTIFTLEGLVKSGNVATNLAKVTKNVAIKSNDNYLKDLKLNGKSVTNFSKDTYTYSIQVPSITATVAIDAVLNDQTASFADKYGSRSESLAYGENIFEIKVLSASGKERKYVVNITREDNRGTNNDLKKIIINSNKVKINFDSATTLYTIKTYKLDKIDVAAEATDPKATVKIDKPEKFEIGENKVTITVTSEDGKDKVYTLIFNNVDYDIDTSLKNIEIFGLDEDFNFDPKVFDYEIRYKAKYKDKLVIKAEKNTTDEEVQIDEPLLETTSKDIKSGSVVKIRVYSLDGTESMYTITFVKDNRINFFLLLGLAIFVVLLIIFIRLFINKNKEKKQTETKTKKPTTTKDENKLEDLEKTKRLEKVVKQ